MIDILFIAHKVQYFEYDYVERIDTFHRSSRIGTFKNGKSFKLAIYDSRGDWLERLKGLEIREVKCLKDVRISPRERLALQAMNRG